MPTTSPLHHQKEKPKPSTKVTVRLTEEEHALLKKYADKRDISVSELLTEIAENIAQ